MLVANFTTVNPNMGNTRLYEDFSKFLGEELACYTFSANQQGSIELTEKPKLF